MTTPQLGMRELEAAQSQPEVIVNEDLRILEAALQVLILDKDLTVPPVSPAANARYIPAAASTGAWTGKADTIAFLLGATWTFLTPQEGWLVWVSDEAKFYRYTGSAWTEFVSGGAGTSITIIGDDGSPNLTVANATVLHFVNATIEDLGGGSVRITCPGTGSGAAQSHGTLTTLTVSSNTITLDHSLGADFTVTLDANVTTVTHTGQTNGEANWFSLRVVQDGTGGRTFAPPASWIYPSGVSAYTASSGAGDIDLIQGVSYTNGTTWLISYEKDYA